MLNLSNDPERAEPGDYSNEEMLQHLFALRLNLSSSTDECQTCQLSTHYGFDNERRRLLACPKLEMVTICLFGHAISPLLEFSVYVHNI